MRASRPKPNGDSLMMRILSPLAAVLLPLGTSFAAAALADGESLPDGGKRATLPACEIHVAHEAGSVVLEGQVFAAHPVSGTYQLRVWQEGAGSNSISQGGEFTVPAGGSASLGLVSLPVAGSYGATLNVLFDNDPVPCKATAPRRPPLTAK